MQISTIQWGNGLPGFLELIPFLNEQFLDASQENLPILHWNSKNGEWVVIEQQVETTLADSEKITLI